jgi:hypothetical protein
MSKVHFSIEIPQEEKERRILEQQAAAQREQRKQQRQAMLSAIADKKKNGKLTLDDIYTQNQVIIDMLNELMSK